MTPELWQRVEELYHAAYAIPAGERAAFLAEACREDAGLRREVESLLNESSHDGFLVPHTLDAVSGAASGAPAVRSPMTGESLGGYRLDALLGAGGRNLLRGVRADGTDVPLPDVEVRVGGAHRFLTSGMGLVYLPNIETKDFWLLDLATNTTRQLTHFSDRGFLNSFDVTPDGKYLVFDRTRQNSDIVLIDLPAK